jgi:LysR family nitrogen assimilation transcriptional regulator
MAQGTLEAVQIREPQIDWTLCIAMRADQRLKMAIRLVEEAVHQIVQDLVARDIWK